MGGVDPTAGWGPNSEGGMGATRAAAARAAAAAGVTGAQAAVNKYGSQNVMPAGYIGGTYNPATGETTGGHPSEDVMNMDRAAAGMLPGGANYGQVAVMNSQPTQKYRPPQYGNNGGAGYSPVTVQNYPDRTVYTPIPGPQYQPAQYQPPQIGKNVSGAGYTPVTVQNYPDRTEYTPTPGFPDSGYITVPEPFINVPAGAQNPRSFTVPAPFINKYRSPQDIATDEALWGIPTTLSGWGQSIAKPILDTADSLYEKSSQLPTPVNIGSNFMIGLGTGVALLPSFYLSLPYGASWILNHVLPTYHRSDAVKVVDFAKNMATSMADREQKNPGSQVGTFIGAYIGGKGIGYGTQKIVEVNPFRLSSITEPTGKGVVYPSATDTWVKSKLVNFPRIQRLVDQTNLISEFDASNRYTFFSVGRNPKTAAIPLGFARGSEVPPQVFVGRAQLDNIFSGTNIERATDLYQTLPQPWSYGEKVALQPFFTKTAADPFTTSVVNLKDSLSRADVNLNGKYVPYQLIGTAPQMDVTFEQRVGIQNMMMTGGKSTQLYGSRSLVDVIGEPYYRNVLDSDMDVNTGLDIANTQRKQAVEIFKGSQYSVNKNTLYDTNMILISQKVSNILPDVPSDLRGMLQKREDVYAIRNIESIAQNLPNLQPLNYGAVDLSIVKGIGNDLAPDLTNVLKRHPDSFIYGGAALTSLTDINGMQRTLGRITSDVDIATPNPEQLANEILRVLPGGKIERIMSKENQNELFGIKVTKTLGGQNIVVADIHPIDTTLKGNRYQTPKIITDVGDIKFTDATTQITNLMNSVAGREANGVWEFGAKHKRAVKDTTGLYGNLDLILKNQPNINADAVIKISNAMYNLRSHPKVRQYLTGKEYGFGNQRLALISDSILNDFSKFEASREIIGKLNTKKYYTNPEANPKVYIKIKENTGPWDDLNERGFYVGDGGKKAVFGTHPTETGTEIRTMPMPNTAGGMSEVQIPTDFILTKAGKTIGRGGNANPNTKGAVFKYTPKKITSKIINQQLLKVHQDIGVGITEKGYYLNRDTGELLGGVSGGKTFVSFDPLNNILLEGTGQKIKIHTHPPNNLFQRKGLVVQSPSDADLINSVGLTDYGVEKDYVVTSKKIYSWDSTHRFKSQGEENNFIYSLRDEIDASYDTIKYQPGLNILEKTLQKVLYPYQVDKYYDEAFIRVGKSAGLNPQIIKVSDLKQQVKTGSYGKTFVNTVAKKQDTNLIDMAVASRYISKTAYDNHLYDLGKTFEGISDSFATRLKQKLNVDINDEVKEDILLGVQRTAPDLTMVMRGLSQILGVGLGNIKIPQPKETYSTRQPPLPEKERGVIPFGVYPTSLKTVQQYTTKSTVSYPQKITIPYPQKITIPYPQKITAPYPQNVTVPYPQNVTVPYPQKITTPYPQKVTVPYPQKITIPYPQKITIPYPQKITIPYPQKITIPYNTKIIIPPQKKIILPEEVDYQTKPKRKREKGKRFVEIFSLVKYPGFKVPGRAKVKNYKSTGKKFGETFSLVVGNKGKRRKQK